MLDTVNLERLGIPAVVVVTEPFVDAALANARVLGRPDLAMLVVAHDYLEEDADAVRAKLAPRVDELLDKLFVTG